MTAEPFVSFQRREGILRVEVEGHSSLANTVNYWHAIEDEVRREPVPAIMLIDNLRGPELTAEHWRGLVEALSGHGLEAVRIAHVKPRGLQQIEYCELYAREAGFQSRVFDSEVTARLWLRYGEG
ncbi:hypothetical protein [Agrilutibacter solisilvae]|uniref:Uncharacterized protein n=1 Tax=Agrilutibacter solisilvae TaxID=2763317 RepID=A0A974XYN3_9GAMM|nr:hypothetical protein [Lysobacter solisilvae]QSX78207.1 hypothetical protein I8J32_016220 [Lysobacter solisilvae]